MMSRIENLAAEVAQILKSAGVESLSTQDGTPSLAERKLVRIIEGHIKDAGKVLAVDYQDPTLGANWSVLVDTEYAALKAYHAYRGTVRIQKGPRGWSIFAGN